MQPMQDDPNVEHLHRLADNYWAALNAAKAARDKLDAVVQELKKAGYSYPFLAAETGLAQGTIQNIVAKGETNG